jgi:hypothetical protein
MKINNSLAEFCTQVDVRYYLQCLTTSQEWRNYPRFPIGFKTEKSALRTMKKTKEIDTAITEYRIIKKIRTIEIKTTTEIEVLDDRSI